MVFKVNAQEFARELAREAKRVCEDELLDFHRELAMLTLDAAVVNTRRRKGTLAKNWHIAVGQPSDWKDKSLKGGRTGQHPDSAQVARAEAELRRLKLGDDTYTQNNLDYAGYVNYGTAHTKPQLMVERAVALVKRIERRA